MSDEQKRYLVTIDEEALVMMDNHLDFLSNVSMEAAEKLANQLTKGMASLEFMPQRCPAYRTIQTAGNYRRLILGRYQIIFSINEASGTVKVKYILDSRQNSEF